LLGTLCNQVRETGPLQIRITIVVDLVVVRSELGLQVLTYLPSGIELVLAPRVRVANMRASVRFYKDVLGLEIIYGSEGSYFTSLRTKDGDTILNLEHGNASMRWGRVIFHVSDVDRSWAYLMEKGFHPDSPQDASWGERYFHLPDPDGHELSFARPI
jgi:catechol 2,3-dioxygenase-like lactoylglutathione lyase family enzyme